MAASVTLVDFFKPSPSSFYGDLLQYHSPFSNFPERISIPLEVLHRFVLPCFVEGAGSGTILSVA